jgi:hypothetical protein
MPRLAAVGRPEPLGTTQEPAEFSEGRGKVGKVAGQCQAMMQATAVTALEVRRFVGRQLG